MSAHMVASHRNYTRQQKAAYRARVRRRHLHGHAHRLPLRIDTTAFTSAVARAKEGLAKMAASIGMSEQGLLDLAEANNQVMDQARHMLGMDRRHPDELARQLGEWQPKIRMTRDRLDPNVLNLRITERMGLMDRPTAEEILGLDSASVERRKTLEQLLDLPPAPVTPLGSYLGEFANEHHVIDPAELPEGWTQR